MNNFTGEEDLPWMRVPPMSWLLNQSANVASPTSFLPCDGRLIWCVSDILLVVLGVIVVLQAVLCAVVCWVSCFTCRRLKAKIRRLNKGGVCVCVCKCVCMCACDSCTQNIKSHIYVK